MNYAFFTIANIATLHSFPKKMIVPINTFTHDTFYSLCFEHDSKYNNNTCYNLTSY